MKLHTLVASFSLLAASAFAQATQYLQPMATNGGTLRPSQLWIDPSGQNDYDTDAIAWEDFQLPQTTTITHVRWWGEVAPSLGFQISFFNQDPGTIAVQPDIFTGPFSEQIYTTFTQTPAGGSMYRFDLQLVSPITFTANTRYFLSVVGRTPVAGAYWNWAASSSGPNGTFWWQRGLHMYFHLPESRAMGLATSEGWPVGTPYCFGDGSAVPCPCANNGSAGNGCANSFFPGGANASAYGTASVSADSVLLTANGMTGSIAIFFQGATQTAPTVIDDGLGCVGGPIVRLGNKPSNGSSSYPQAGDPTVSVRGGIPAAGGTFYYQCFYRNAASAYCPPATSNRTNGIVIAWGV